MPKESNAQIDARIWKDCARCVVNSKVFRMLQSKGDAMRRNPCKMQGEDEYFPANFNLGSVCVCCVCVPGGSFLHIIAWFILPGSHNVEATHYMPIFVQFLYAMMHNDCSMLGNVTQFSSNIPAVVQFSIFYYHILSSVSTRLYWTSLTTSLRDLLNSHHQFMIPIDTHRTEETSAVAWIIFSHLVVQKIWYVLCMCCRL